MASTVQSLTAPGVETVAIPTCSLAMAFGYTGDNLSTATVVFQGITYIQTFTYSGDDLINVSSWVPQ